MKRPLFALVTVGLAVATTVALPAAAHVNHVEVDPQVSSDGRLVAETAFVASDSFLVVHRDAGGSPGEPVGYTYLPGDRGQRTDVAVTVARDVWADWESGKLWFVLHADDGDGTFEPEQDAPAGQFGEAAESPVTVAKGDRSVVTAIGFAPLRLHDGNVTVRTATLPQDGQLLVRNASSGRVLGRRTLAAGTHRRVNVTLNDSALAGRESAVLEAVVAGPDGDPLTAGGEAVATRFSVTIASGGTATASPNGEGRATTTGQPGFGGAVALAALVAVALLWRPRR